MKCLRVLLIFLSLFSISCSSVEQTCGANNEFAFKTDAITAQLALCSSMECSVASEISTLAERDDERMRNVWVLARESYLKSCEAIRIRMITYIDAVTEDVTNGRMDELDGTAKIRTMMATVLPDYFAHFYMDGVARTKDLSLLDTHIKMILRSVKRLNDE